MQTLRGCAVTFEEGEEFKGKELFVIGEGSADGYWLNSNNMKWISQENGKTIGRLIDNDIKEKLISLLVDGGKKQGIMIAFYEGQQNV
ncbi:MAG: hypothetical protein LBU09_02210 [Endomicrobium sp.]|nr:hypothetical protein [Endomicrobium sp.]